MPLTEAEKKVIYRVLREYQDGKIEAGCIGVGMLSTELSTVFLAIEERCAALENRDGCHARDDLSE